MKNSKFIFTIFAAVIAAAVFTADAARAAEKYEIDPAHSSACFKIKHLDVAFVHGCFPDISGSVGYDRKAVGKSSVDILIKTTSVNTFVAQRDEHLRTADFLDVEKFPEMSFKSVSVKPKGKTDVEITGDFTLHGVTKRIKAIGVKTGEGKDPWGGFRVGFKTEFKIKRSDYGMKTMIPAVGDQVWITVMFEAVKK